MTAHLSEEQLNDYVDDVLDPAQRAQAESHFAVCPSCAHELNGLRALVQRVHVLPLDVKPERDLLAGIHSEIDREQVIPLPATRRHALWSMRWSLASAALVLIISTALITRALSRSPATLDTPLQQGTNTLVSDELRGLERKYLSAIEELQLLVREQNTEISPETRVLLEQNLRVIDRAIRDSRGAMQQDPGNEMVNQMLWSNYEKKLDLLRRATSMAGT